MFFLILVTQLHVAKRFELVRLLPKKILVNNNNKLVF